MAILFYNQWYDAFNNFSPHAVEIDGVIYQTAEHAYQAAKCTDTKGKLAIQNAKSPMLAKEAANQTFKSAKNPGWDKVKLEVMESILRAKLAQHQEVRDALRRSGNQEIAEDSPTDYFWGRGNDGSGQNWLGRLWMKIRDEAKN